MSTWNYRVFRQKDGSHHVHEAYYKRKNKVNSWTKNPSTPYGETAEELKQSLEQMLKAFEKPILDYDTGKKIK